MNTITQKLKDSHFTYAFLILLIAILGYWQIASLKYSVTHDMINCWIPWRYYISECFRNHVFPFWNPYQQLGYPIHADLQGPTWYLESILLSMTTGQTNYTLHFLFIFYVSLAGMGMYFLSLALHSNRLVAFLTGICYMMGGFFVAHVQHFYAIIGAAWLPFIILNYYRMYEQKSYMHALYTAIFMFFNLTGGNHTFSIILLYLFATMFGYYTVSAFLAKRKSDVLAYIKLNVLFGVTSILLAFVVIVAFSQTAPFIARLSGMTYKAASNCPLSPQSLLSLLLPFSTVNSVDFFNTDQSMCNIYVGSIMFIFIALSFFSKKTALEKILLAFAIICLLASFGAYTPVHKFLFNYFPLINRFRFPSYFSLFSIVIFLVFAGKQIALFAETKSNKKLLRLSCVAFSALSLLIILAFFKNKGQEFFFTKSYDSIFDFMKSASLYQNIILQGILQLLLIGLFIATLVTPLKKHWLKILCVLVIADMTIATRLNIGYVGFSPSSPKELHDYIVSLPHNFPIPDTNYISTNTEQLGQLHGLYRNTSLFHRRISSNAFNSYVFKNCSTLEDSIPLLFGAMRQNPLVYFSDNIYPENTLSVTDTNKINHKTIVLTTTDYNILKNQIDTTGNSNSGYTITAFGPNTITVIAKSSKQELLTLLQSYYPGWQASIDGQSTKIYLSNYLTMSVLFPKGEHKITFSYSNLAIVKAATISYTTFITLLIFFSYSWIRKNKNYYAPAFIWLILIGSVLYYFL